MDLVLHFDGSCNPNPGGRMGYGWHLDTAAGVRVGEYRGEVLGYPPEHRTNNTAEYYAALKGLEFTAAYRGGGVGRLVVAGDSQLVINALAGRWRAKRPHLAALRDRCLEAASRVRAGVIEYVWVPREENREADLLSGPGRVVPPAVRPVIGPVRLGDWRRPRRRG